MNPPEWVNLALVGGALLYLVGVLYASWVAWKSPVKLYRVRRPMSFFGKDLFTSSELYYVREFCRRTPGQLRVLGVRKWGISYPVELRDLLGPPDR